MVGALSSRSVSSMADMLRCGLWVPGDGPQMRAVLTRPCGRWLRVCRGTSWIVVERCGG